MDTKLTEHFTLEELTTTNKSAWVDKNRMFGLSNINRLIKLAIFAESVRNILGCPLTINSGARCPELNKAVGGSKTSQHVCFEAIDFVPNGMGLREAFNILRSSKIAFYGQLIYEPGWIHISIGSKKENLIFDGRHYNKA